MSLPKRIFDLVIAISAGILLFVPMMLIAILIKASSRGPILYWSDRVGSENVIFSMPKFRSMQIGTPALATHLLDNPDCYVTSVGKFLRRTSLDEVPQIWSILRGDMSLVGPRPALFNQEDLIQLRTERGIHHLVPGLTGWAQINGRDELSISEKVKLDEEYLNCQSLMFDTRILITTFFGVLARKGVSH
jgi:O-antigen biosynthesis protein WbqP